MEKLKQSEGKLPWDLAPIEGFEQVIKVMENSFKSGKYKRDSWKELDKEEDIRSIIGACYRHLAQIKKGELYDNESGLSHFSHLATNAVFLAALYEAKPDNKGFLFNPIKVDNKDVVSTSFELEPIPITHSFERYNDQKEESRDSHYTSYYDDLYLKQFNNEIANIKHHPGVTIYDIEILYDQYKSIHKRYSGMFDEFEKLFRINLIKHIYMLCKNALNFSDKPSDIIKNQCRIKSLEGMDNDVFDFILIQLDKINSYKNCIAQPNDFVCKKRLSFKAASGHIMRNIYYSITEKENTIFTDEEKLFVKNICDNI